VHVEAFRQAGYEVAALVGRDLERTRAAARDAKVEGAFDSLAKAMKQCEPAVVSIAVPPAAQAGLACEAVRGGSHLFCEKPLATTVADARRIVETAKAHDRHGAVDFIFPEIPAWQKLKELVQGGELGAVTKASVCWKVETRAARSKVVSWKNDTAQGGGVLFNFVPHTVHYLQWLFGPVTSVHALPVKNPAIKFIGTITFASGLEVDVQVDSGAFMGLGHRLEIFAENGTAVLQNPTRDYVSGFTLEVARRDAMRWESVMDKPGESAADGRITAVASILRRLRESILSGAKLRPSLLDGLEAQAVLHAFQQSAAGSCAASLP